MAALLYLVTLVVTLALSRKVSEAAWLALEPGWRASLQALVPELILVLGLVPEPTVSEQVWAASLQASVLELILVLGLVPEPTVSEQVWGVSLQASVPELVLAALLLKSTKIKDWYCLRRRTAASRHLCQQLCLSNH